MDYLLFVALYFLIVWLMIALVVYGPKHVPEIGASLGKAIRGLKAGLKEEGEKDGPI